MTVDLMSAIFFRPEGPLPATTPGFWSAVEAAGPAPEARADAVPRRGDLWPALLRRLRSRATRPASP